MAPRVLGTETSSPATTNASLPGGRYNHPAERAAVTGDGPVTGAKDL